MNLSIVSSFVAGYSADIVLYIFWFFVAVSVLAPLILAEAAYHHSRISNRYHFRENHILKLQKRNYYFRRMTLFGGLLILDSTLVLYILVH